MLPSKSVDFAHKAHIGWTPGGGFDIRDLPSEWKDLFKAAGIKPSELKDKDTAKLVIDTIAEAFIPEPNESISHRPLSGTQALPAPNTISKIPPPRPASLPPIESTAPRIPPPRPTVPAPAASAPLVAPAAEDDFFVASGDSNPIIQGGESPLHGDTPGLTTNPFLSVTDSPVQDTVRDDYLDDFAIPVAQEIAENSVPLAPPPPPPSLPPKLNASSASSNPSPKRSIQPRISPTDSRNELLEQIRQGKQLREVAPNEALPSISSLSAEESNSLASILAKAMATRRLDIKQDALEEEDGWDD